MICRLCCEECLDFEDLFDKNDQENYIYKICQKFFSREMEELVKTLNKCSKIICDTCWKTIHEFNEFYEKIVAQQTDYCSLINASKSSLELPEVTDNLLVKSVEGAKSEFIDVKDEFLRESSVESSKSSDLEDNSCTSDTFMKTITNNSASYDSEMSGLNDSVEIKVEEEVFIDDVEESELSEDDDESQSASNSVVVVDDIVNKDQEGETTNSSSKELNTKIIQEIEYDMLSGKWKLIFRCDICNFSADGYTKFLKHYTQASLEELNSGIYQKPLECEICHKWFSQQIALKRHLSNHTDGEQKYECPQCQERFDDLSAQNSHIKFAHSEIILKYGCDVCGVQLAAKRNVDLHKASTICKPLDENELSGSSFDSSLIGKANKIINEIKDRKFKPTVCCDLCEFSSDSITIFVNHYKEAHPNNLNSPTFQKPFECELCHNRFGQKSSLHRHLYIHAMNEDPQNTKGYCGAQLSTKNNVSVLKASKFGPPLLDEAKAILNETKNGKWNLIFRCDLCEFSSENTTLFLTHYQAAHPNNLNSEKFQKPFECQVCHTCFRCKSNLRRHLLCHRKIFNEGDFSSFDPPLLDEAKRIINEANNGKWKLILRCDVCEFSSDSYRKFIAHYKNTHPDNLNSQKFRRPFECEICHTSFRSKIYLRTHLYTHRIIKDPKNPQCRKNPNDLKVTSVSQPIADKINKILKDIKDGAWTPILRCDLCEFSTERCKKFKKHYKKAHPSNLDSLKFQRPYECEICHQGFKHNGSLRLHLPSHKYSPEHYECPHCGKRYVWKNSLIHHIKLVHQHLGVQ